MLSAYQLLSETVANLFLSLAGSSFRAINPLAIENNQAEKLSTGSQSGSP